MSVRRSCGTRQCGQSQVRDTALQAAGEGNGEAGRKMGYEAKLRCYCYLKILGSPWKTLSWDNMVNFAFLKNSLSLLWGREQFGKESGHKSWKEANIGVLEGGAEWQKWRILGFQPVTSKV